MKKTLTAAALSSVLVLGLAAASMAADAATTTGVVAKGASKITLDGNVRERGMYNKVNSAQDTPGQTGYDNRVQLGVNAQVSDQATGYVQMETGQGNSDVYQWGQPGTYGTAAANAAASSLMDGGNKGANSTMSLMQAWVNYKPGAWGVKAGHMPLALGNKVFFDHTGSGDDALVFYADPDAATHVGALTIKFDEQNLSDNSDDLDGYVALVTHKLNDNVNLGANLTYLRGGSADASGEFMNGLSMSNLGLTADGKVGALALMGDLEFQFGNLGDNGTTTTDASGWAMKLGADYDLGAGKVGLLFGMGSGDDNATDNDADQFVNFLTDTTYDTIIAGYRAAIPGAQWANGTGKNSGLDNLTLIQLKGSTKVTCPLTGKDLALLGTVSYMQLTEDTMTYNGGAARTTGEDNVGTEVDLIATWALTPGLSYKVEAAYLFVGDVYNSAATGAGADPDDLAFLRHSLDLKF